MAETELEKFFKRVKRILCDWGMAYPKKQKNGVFYDNSAPVWRCPSPILLLIAGSLHLLIFIITLTITAYMLDFDGKCSPNTTSARNILIFFFLFNGGFLFYMSRSQVGTDKQWCRYITISLLTLGIQIFLSVILGSLLGGNCKTTDKSTYDIGVACSLLGIVLSSIGIGAIIFTIVKLYFIGNPLAYNQEIN